MSRPLKPTGSTYHDTPAGRRGTARDHGRRRGLDPGEQAQQEDDVHRFPRGRSRLDTIWEGR